MRLAELADYAEEKYGIPEDRKWTDFPGFSVLSDPGLGKWIALFMRHFDPVSAETTERCDLKCGREVLEDRKERFLCLPFRMKGPGWIGIRFDSDTDRETVFELFDQAVERGKKGFKDYLSDGSIRKGFGPKSPPVADAGGNVYTDTPIPGFSAGRPEKAGVPKDISAMGRPALGALRSGKRIPGTEEVPEKIRAMLKLYRFGRGSFEEKCRNFLRQGLFMQDYEDDYSWEGEFEHYFPTYHDMNIRQLRGYFSWRTKLRRGEFSPAAKSMAYVYLYELLNGIGCSSPEDSLGKMMRFEEGYLDAGFGDSSLRRNLNSWMFEFAVLHGLPEDLVLRTADAGMLRTDRALLSLREPERAADESLVEALKSFAGEKAGKGSVTELVPEKANPLFAAVWRKLMREYTRDGEDIFTCCFGKKSLLPWHPLENALVLKEKKQEDSVFSPDPCRTYACKNGVWHVECYNSGYLDRKLLKEILHECERQVRKALNAGSRLRERDEEAWVRPYIAAVIEENRRAEAIASRPEITIDFSGLERIRRDAGLTRDSLLSEEELRESEEAARKETGDVPKEESLTVPHKEVFPETAKKALQEDQASGSRGDAFFSSPVYADILRCLLRDESPSELIRTNRLMPEIVADEMNEALFETFADMVIECEGQELRLVEDYREDLESLMGGNG